MMLIFIPSVFFPPTATTPATPPFAWGGDGASVPFESVRVIMAREVRRSITPTGTTNVWPMPTLLVLDPAQPFPTLSLSRSLDLRVFYPKLKTIVNPKRLFLYSRCTLEVHHTI
jgi:hypothetical protein